MFLPVDFGQRIRGARKALGLTQVELAKASGVTQGAISELERGESKTAHSDNLVRIAAALKVSPEWLTTGAGHKIPPIYVHEQSQIELLTIYAALPEPLRDALLGTARNLLKALGGGVNN